MKPSSFPTGYISSTVIEEYLRNQSKIHQIIMKNIVVMTGKEGTSEPTPFS